MKTPGILQARIIWAALLGSQAMYLFLLVGGILRAPSEPPPPIMLTAISGVAMVVGMASIFLPRFFVAQLPRQLTERDRGLRDHGRDALLGRAMQLGFVPFILGMALAEAVAIFGLVLGALGFHLLTVLPFFLAAALITVTKFPTEGRFLAPFEEALSRRAS